MARRGAQDAVGQDWTCSEPNSLKGSCADPCAISAFAQRRALRVAEESKAGQSKWKPWRYPESLAFPCSSMLKAEAVKMKKPSNANAVLVKEDDTDSSGSMLVEVPYQSTRSVP